MANRKRGAKRAKESAGLIRFGLCMAAFLAVVCASYPYMAGLVSFARSVQVGKTQYYTEQAAPNDDQEDNPEAQDSFIDFSFLLPKVEVTPQPTKRPEGAVDIKTVNLSPQSGIAFGSGKIKNNTDLDEGTVGEILNTASTLKVEVGSDKPQVLIMHTHTTESYENYDLGYYLPENPTRSTDNSQNMVRVGQEIASVLNANGICTVQDTTQCDNPEYTGAYDRSREVVKEYLKKYPSIKIVLDVHRDAITYSQDNTRGKPTVSIDGKNAAQMMIIVGCNGTKTPIPNFKDNLRFGAALNSAVEKKYPGLMRSVLFRYSFYNQDLTTGSILVEMGSAANTLSEAVYSGKLLGQAMAEYLKG